MTAALIIMCSCHGMVTSPTDTGGDTLQMSYAHNLRIIHYDNYVKVEIQNPWRKGSLLHTYILSADKTNVPDITATSGTVSYISTPLRSAAVYSSVHCSMVNELGALNAISAVCDIQYIHQSELLDAYHAGHIKDLGSSMAPNIEQLIDIAPGAILLSPFENSGGYGLVEQLDIPIVECADYMEPSPLARAEWIKFYGLLFGREAQADSIFSNVESQYTTLKAQAQAATNHPSVVLDLITSSTWYVPGGRSTLGQLVLDAGGNYVFSQREESGSIPLAPETVFDCAQDADIWLIRYTRDDTDETYSTLQTHSPMYSKMKAFETHQVYGCNLSYTPFFEQTPLHPERLLRDFIILFKTSQDLNDAEPVYFKPLK